MYGACVRAYGMCTCVCMALVFVHMVCERVYVCTYVCMYVCEAFVCT